MTNTWVLSALWVGLALVATLLAISLRISTALSEIIVGTVAQLVIGAAFAGGGLVGTTDWIRFLAGTGAIVLTFLAGEGLKAITQAQYSYVAGTIIVSAVIPTLIANSFFLPRHLLPTTYPSKSESGKAAQPSPEPEAV